MHRPKFVRLSFPAPRLLGLSVAMLVVAPPVLVRAASASGTVSNEPPGVVGGSAVTTCNWPTTVWLGVQFEGCTATLIDPRVVTTAAHCTPEPTGQKISFGERGSPAFSVTASKCVNSFQMATRDDWAYCILPDDDRLKRLPILPPLVGCEANRFLKAGAKVWVVGYGITGNGKNDQGTKRAVETSILDVGTGPGLMGLIGGEGTITVGDGMKGGCEGDSGGPVFMHLEDGDKDWGFRTVGITSGSATEANCAGPGLWGLIGRVVERIEKDEGIDVTPCTNSQGAWDTGPACKDFPTDPGNAGGAWPACNAGTKTSAPIDSCGAQGIDGGGPGSTDAATDAKGDVGAVLDAGDASHPTNDGSAGAVSGGRGGSSSGVGGSGGQAGAGMHAGAGGSSGAKGGDAIGGSGGSGAWSSAAGEGCSCGLHAKSGRSLAPAAYAWFLAASLRRRRRRARGLRDPRASGDQTGSSFSELRP